MQSNRDLNRQINIWEVAVFIGAHWLWLLGGALLGGALGVLLFVLLPPKFEASVVVQPARIGSITAGAMASTIVQGTEPEPSALMIERLKAPSFFVDSIRQRCHVADEPGYQKNMASDLSANVVKLPNPSLQSLSMAKLSWKAESPEVAEDCVAAIIEALAEGQDKIIAPAVATLAAQRDITQRQLQLYLAELDKLGQNRFGDGAEGKAFNQLVIADKSAQNLRESVVTVRKQLAEEEAQLTAPYTQSLSRLEPIYASREPAVTLKVALSVGVLIGVLLGVTTLLLRRSVGTFCAKELP